MRRAIRAGTVATLLLAITSCSSGGNESRSADRPPTTGPDLPEDFPTNAIPLPHGRIVETFTNADGWGVTMRLAGDVFDIADEYQNDLEGDGFTVERISEDRSTKQDLVNWVGEHNDWGMTATITSKGARRVLVNLTVASSDRTQLPSERELDDEAGDDYDFNVGSELPEGFPATVPLPSASVVASATWTSGEDPVWEIQFELDTGASEAADVYRDTLEGAGFATAPLFPWDDTIVVAFIADNNEYEIEVFGSEDGGVNGLTVLVTSASAI